MLLHSVYILDVLLILYIYYMYYLYNYTVVCYVVSRIHAMTCHNRVIASVSMSANSVTIIILR